MYFKRIESQGLAHYSYLVGDGRELAVIDPRRDIYIYLEEAQKAGMKIKYILETHRNEDYIIGSMELASKTGATIYVSGHEDLGHLYGDRLYDKDILEVGNLKIKALHTPGHTLGHMSYAVYEENRDKAYMVFTGDCLFMGDLGRTDFYGEENLEKMTGLLYESVFNKLMPLGDDVLIFPAHGAGSACGESMEDRPYSTLGYERSYNERLQAKSKEEFIRNFGTMRIKPRYFEYMEVYNVKGAPYLGGNINLNPLLIDNIAGTDITLIDSRSKEAYYGGHIPNTIFFSLRNFSSYIGSILDINSPIAFIVENNNLDKLKNLYWFARRIGFENIKGYIADGNIQWEEDLNRNLEKLATITPEDFIALDDDYILLDIRKAEDLEHDDPSKNRINIPLQLLYRDYINIPKNKPIYVLCGSGDRATTAASYLKSKGYDGRVIAGGLKNLKPLMRK